MTARARFSRPVLAAAGVLAFASIASACSSSPSAAKHPATKKVELSSTAHAKAHAKVKTTKVTTKTTVKGKVTTTTAAKSTPTSVAPSQSSSPSPQPAPSSLPTPQALVEASAGATLGAHSANLNISFTVSGDFSGSTGTLSGSISGPYSFANNIGSLQLTMNGSAQITQLLGAGSHAIVLADGTAYIQPASGSVLASAAGGKPYVSIALGPLFSQLLPSAGPLASTIASNPGEALQLFSSPADQVSSAGTANIGGVSTYAYNVTVPVAAAAQAGGAAASIYQAIEKSSPSTSSISAELWINGSDQIVQLQISGSVPPSNGATVPTNFDVTLGVSGYGVSVNASVPPASEVYSFSG